MRFAARLAAIAALVPALSAGELPSTTARATAPSAIAPPTVSAPHWLIAPTEDAPSPLAAVPGVALNTAHNNLAIKLFDGRLYVAFRAATHHHPKPPIWAPQYLRVRSATTRMYVVSAKLTPELATSFETEAPKLEWRLELDVHAALVDRLRAEAKALLRGDEAAVRYFVVAFEKEVSEKLLAAAAARRTPEPSERDVERFLADQRSVLLEFDLREPLFFAIGGKLHFYFAQVEGRSMRFNPLRVWNFTKGATWEAPVPVLSAGEHFWDIQVRKEGRTEVAYLSSYSGAHYVINADERNNLVHFRRSLDGLQWAPVGGRNEVYRGGASEAAFLFPPGEKEMIAVMRLDDGDERGWGSLLAHAPASAPGMWRVPARADPQRFDSPRLFAHDGDIYLVARQNLCQGPAGKFDEGVNCPFDRAFVGQDEKTAAATRETLFDKITKKILSRKLVSWQESEVMQGDEAEVAKRGERMLAQLERSIIAGKTAGEAGTPGTFNPGLSLQYEYTYHFTLPKRTAVYRLDRKTGRWEIVVGLPSAGDTAFPSVEQLADGVFLVANYTSDPKNREWTWRDGQQSRSGLYLVRLGFPAGQKTTR